MGRVARDRRLGEAAGEGEFRKLEVHTEAAALAGGNGLGWDGLDLKKKGGGRGEETNKKNL